MESLGDSAWLAHLDESQREDQYLIGTALAPQEEWE